MAALKAPIDLLVYRESEDRVLIQGTTGRAIRLLTNAGHGHVLLDQTTVLLTEGPFKALMERADALELRSLTLGSWDG